MTTTAEFFQQHAPDGNLTPEQAAQLLELTELGDTGAAAGGTPDTGSAPSATPAPEAQPPGAAQTTENPSTDPAGQPPAATDPASAVILAKDGKHTIPYEKLIEAREGEKQWRDKAQAALQELDALKAQAQQRADAGQIPTQADQNLAIAEQAIDRGADPDLFGDFSEEAIAKGVQSLVDQRVQALVDEKVNAALAPLQQQQEADLQRQQAAATEAHFRAIYEKHPDADSIAESQELADWIKAQPSFARAGIEAVLQKGSAAEVIELLDQFKGTAGKTQPAADDAAAKEAAKQAIAKARAPVPGSLSDIPGGTAGPGSRDEALAKLSAPDMADAMANMTPAQIEEFLNRSL